MSQLRRVSSNRNNQLACFAYGVGHGSDEGVCLLIQMGSHRILLDCGLADLGIFQAQKQAPADLVFCTHAHPDHARGLLELHRTFPQMPIYASEVTAKLLPINWLEESPLALAEFFQPLQMRTPIEFAPDLFAELFPAGHLPGATSVLFTHKTPQRAYKVLYTGDFSVSNFQLVEGLSIEALRGLAPDVLIIEGSYGTARHPHRRQQEKQLMERIARALARHRNVLLPVPTLGLGQEILKLLRSHHQFTGRNIDIWVDGSVAIACDIYLEILSQFPASVQNFAKHQSLFWDERVYPRMRRLSPENLALVDRSPGIVLTDSVGDIQKYFHSESSAWSILVPEHPQISSTSILDRLAATPNLVADIDIETYLLAEHSDGRNTTQLIHNIRPQHVIFIHGSPTYLADLTSLEELQNRYQLHLPAAGSLVELPIGDKFVQPATLPQTAYEGELNESGTFVTLTLPDTIAADPRWSKFADTGIVEARWQGEELVLRGLSQRELLSSSSEHKRLADLDCCGNCLHFRNQHCWNPASPLYQFKVTPDGYCPVFELSEELKEDIDA